MRAPRFGIWVWSFGYFAAYAPYSLLTKALSDGRLGPAVSGQAILPVSTLASLGTMTLVLAVTGWWRDATRTRWETPRPTRLTALSGLCGATILTTTTLAYTFENVSIVFMMVLMRGGVLVMAPIVDALTGRVIKGRSWVALMLTITSLGVAAIGRLTLSLTWAAATNIALYLGAYFVRLRLMSRLAKSDDHAAGWRYFVEEQLVSTPAAFVGLAILAWSGVADFREGFTDVPRGPQWPWAAIIGILSQGTGVFGALVLLDKAENTFSVPVNRASSVLAGVVASLFLWSALAGPPIPVRELLAAALVVIAIVVLTLPDSKKRRT